MGWKDDSPVVTKDAATTSWKDDAPVLEGGFSDDEIRPYHAALAGASQGLTLGFGDEIAGGLGAVYDKLTGSDKDLAELYRENRDAKRAAYERVKEKYPGTYSTFDFAGGVAPAFLTGGTSLAPTTIKGAIGLGAAGGAAAGLGYSEADNAVDLAKDVAAGGAIGGAGAGIASAGVKGIGKLIGAADDSVSPAVRNWVANKMEGAKTGAKNMSRKALASITSTDDDVLQKYIANRELVNAARPVDEIAADVTTGLGSLKDRVISGSREAVENLGDDAVDISRPLAALRSRINEINATGVTDYSEAAAKKLGKIASKLDWGSTPGQYDPKVLKGAIKEIDQITNWASKPGDFDPILDRELKTLRRGLDEALKSSSDDYARAMQAVAADAGALNEATSKLGNPDTVAGKLKTLGGPRAVEKPETMQALKGLDERLGTNLFEENQARGIQNYFNQDLSGGRGPRNRIIGAVLGGASGGAPGAVTGIVAGQMLDQGGRKAAKAAVDTAMSVAARPSARKIGELIPKLPAKFAETLTRAAERGPESMGAAHFILWKNNQEYRDSVKGTLMNAADSL